MSEVENLELENEVELETEEELEYNPTTDLVNALQKGDFNSADQLFKDILSDKVQSTLDAEKVAVAGQIFNGEEPYAEIDDEDLEDNHISDSVEDVEDVQDEIENIEEVE